MSGGLVVDIASVTSTTQPPATEVVYKVRNTDMQPVWMVDDGWLIFRQDGDLIEVSFARGRLRKGVQVFGYFAPAVLRLNPSEQVERHFTLTWPLELDRMWNVDRIAAPTPGKHRLSIRVGYGITPQADEPKSGKSVDGPIDRWQRLGQSAPVTFRIPAYEGSTSGN